MPIHHRHFRDINQDELMEQAQTIGESTAALVCAVFSGEKHPEQKKRTATGILRLHREYGERLEAACRRALFLQSHSLQSIISILKYRLDEAELPTAPTQLPVADHSNLRGPRYFADSDETEVERILN